MGLFWGAGTGALIWVSEGGNLQFALLVGVVVGVLFFGPFMVFAAWRDKQDFGIHPLTAVPDEQLPPPRTRYIALGLMGVFFAAAFILAMTMVVYFVDLGRHKISSPGEDAVTAIVLGVLSGLLVWAALVFRRKARGEGRPDRTLDSSN